MVSAGVGRAARGVLAAVLVVVTTATAAAALPPPAAEPERAAARTPLAEVAGTPEPEVPEKTWQVDAGGAFGDRVPIEVPAFRGITPQLSLTYDSSGGNGWTGVGWDLRGVGRIERAAPGRGAPRYDDTDVHLLDGRELIACPAGGTSPGCASGGTHATLDESYLKITRSGTGAASRWTAVAKDGVRRVYAPVHSPAADRVFRWGLSEVTDTSGNVVTYHWSGDRFGCCWDHLDSVTYNGTTVELHYETRPDHHPEAAGAGGLVTALGRIKTIDVSVNGSRLRAYRLDYTTSPSTSRSLLTSVRQFGRDAVLDPSGTVTGGTGLPAVTAGYRPGTAAFTAGAVDTLGNNANAKYLPLDIDGDGRTDMLELWPNWTVHERRSWLSTGTGFTLASTHTDLPLNTRSRFLTGDVSGDGRHDLVELYPNGFSWGRRLWVSTGTGFTLAATGNSRGGFNENSRFLSLDVDGDGRTDVLELYYCGLFPAHFCRATWLSTGTGFTLASHDTGIAYHQDKQFHALDVNGDGRDDFVELYGAGGYVAGRRTWLSTGTGFTAGALDTDMSWAAPTDSGPGSRFHAMDVNGDDRSDLVELYPHLTTFVRRTWLSTGYGFALTATDTTMSSGVTTKHLVVDVNGDHRADMVELSPYGLSTRRRVWLSTGTGFTAGAVDTIAAYSCSKGSCTAEFLEMDVDGDGVVEVVELSPADFGWTKGRRVWRVDGGQPDLLTTRTDAWGATTRVDYTPSSAWSNTGNPPVAQTASKVVVDDGRGGAATTTFTYAGGAHHWPERRFLGFRSRRETLPCIAGETACPYTETWFKQDPVALGHPERVERRDGGGALLTSTVHEYAVDAAALPRTALPTGTWQTTYAGPGEACPGAGCKRTYTTRRYNAYGEVTQQVEHGDHEQAGDERTTTTVFVPNTDAYVVDKPAVVTVSRGAGPGGARLTETRSHYDGAGGWDQPPSAGLETRTGRWLSTTGSFVETAREYDARGNLTAEVDALGARTTLDYDPVHHLYQTSETDALGRRVTAGWDPVCGRPTQLRDLNAQVTTLTYDALCRRAEKGEPGGGFERYRWVDLGDPATQHELVERPAPAGTGGTRWTRRYVDGLQRTWRRVDRGPDEATGDIHVDTTHNARGQVASKTAPHYRPAGRPQPATHPTTTDYDALDRQTTETLPGGATRTKSYGPWTVTTTDERGNASTDRVDAYRQRVARTQVVNGESRTAHYAFDLLGKLVRSTDPAGGTIDYAVDSLGRTTGVVDPDSGTTTYEWDAAGRLVAQTDAKDQRTTFTHDALGRRTGKTTNAGTGAAVTVSWIHDQARAGYHNTGKVTTVTDPAGTRTLDHDELGRVVRVVRTIDGADYTFRHGFDPGGRLLWTSYPDGDTLGTPESPLRHDSAGRVAAIPGYVDSARYDAEGRLVHLDNANGTVTTRPHDPGRGWLTGIRTTSGAAVIQDSGYARDAEGRITRITSPFAGEGWTYAYDGADQLTAAAHAAGDQTFGYDATGNVTSNSRLGAYTYGTPRPHAVTTAGANSYAYDAAGLMTSGAGRTLTWDGDNRLAAVTRQGVTSTYAYDADGNRVRQTDGTTTRHHPDDDYEVDLATGTATKYVSIAGTLVARAVGGTRYWVHTDHQGSVQAETDAAGAEVHRRSYHPHGAVLGASGTTEPRGFTGRHHEPSGLIHLKARYYDPDLGRFTSPNPVVDGEDNIGLNRYAYAANDPVNHTDPTGLDCERSGDRCDRDRRGDGIAPAGMRELVKYEWNKFRGILAHVAPRVIKKVPGANAIVATASGYRSQDDWARQFEPGERSPFVMALGRGWHFARNGTSTLVDNALLNVPGWLKYEWDRRYIYNTSTPSKTYPVLGQVENCRSVWLC